jgi:hypothetical protein
MNFKRYFMFELISGLVLFLIPVLAFFIKLEMLGTRKSNLFLFSILSIAGSALYRKPLKPTDWERLIFKKTGAFTGFLLGFLALLFVMETKSFNSGMETVFGAYWVFSFFSFFLLIHSLFGFYILSRYPKPVNMPEPYKPEGAATEQPEYLKILNYPSLLLIIFCGIGIFAFCLFCLADGSSVMEALAIPVSIVVIMILVTFINAKIHNLKILDERERHLIFKITSITAFLSLLILVILFACKDYYIFGYLISYIWGLAIVPLAMVLWGTTGLVVLAKEEEGGIIHALRKTNQSV